METILCVGIDPAPSGKANRGNAVVILGGAKEPLEFWQSRPHNSLRSDLQEWAALNRVVVAWDAPLTGPADPDSSSAGAPHRETRADFTKRRIEQVFSSGDWKPPSGVSVQAYAQCQHWTISRNLLGLPRVGKYDNKELPFRLLTSKPENWEKPSVVEVHPALAMWLWLRKEKLPPETFRYKGKAVEGCNREQQERNRRTLLDALLKVWQDLGVPKQLLPLDKKEEFVQLSDLLDALVGAMLAYFWTKGSEEVRLLGDQRSGTFLLPTRTGLPELAKA